VFYLVAILAPPAAVWLCGRTHQLRKSLLLTLAFYLPGVLHALSVASEYYAIRRARRPVLGRPNPFGS